MKLNYLIIIFLLGAICFNGCTKDTPADPVPNPNPQDTLPNDTTPTDTLPNYQNLAVGYRWSPYGIGKDPGIDYYGEIGTRLSGYFGKSVKPSTIWILGTLYSGGACGLNFPATPTDKLIKTSSTDFNEKILSRFDSLGYQVWLQVEPGFADVTELINLVLARYKHHSCVYGFGVDVEWHKSDDDPEAGVAVSDSLANAWLAAIKSHNPKYKLFLKHWLTEKMPSTVREDIVFIDDSQIFDNMDQMVSEFEDWANYFKPATVGFQYGYESDEKWWSKYENPVLTIGEEILKRTSNTGELYWVDFTLQKTYPKN